MNGKLLPLALVGISLAFAACSHPNKLADKSNVSTDRAPAAAKNWKFDYAKFYIDDVINAKTGKSVFEKWNSTYSDQHGNSECRADLALRDVIQGHITIYQYSDDTYIRSFRQIEVPNVQARMEITGVVLQCHLLRKNSSWSIRNLSGKKVEDIFKTKYHGGKLGVSVGVSVAVNLNESVVVNAKGVTITNMEQLFDVGNLGAGLTIGYHSVTFDQSNLRGENQTININHSREDGTSTSKSTATFDEAMKLGL